MDFAPWRSLQVKACKFWQGKVLAKRHPLLLFRLVGVLLFRLEERAFDSLLLKEPPRNTRLISHSPLKTYLTKKPFP